MLFSELALEGVRNFSELRRISMGAGLSVYLGGNQTGKSTLIDLILHLLYPDPIEPATEAFRSPQGGPCRASLVLEDQKSGRYRLVKDLLGGKTALTKWDASSSRFVAVTSSASEILQYLRGQLGLPQQDVFKELYVVRDNDLPSALPQAGGSGSGFMPAPRDLSRSRRPSTPMPAARKLPPSQSFPGYQGLDPEQEVLPDDPSEIRSQLKTLETDLAMTREVDEWQFKLDGLQSKLFELDEKLKSVNNVTLEVERLEAKLQPFSKLNEMPANFEQRVRSYEKDKEKLNRDLARLSEDAQKWEGLIQEGTNRSIWGNKVFLSGLLMGIAALGVGVAGFYLLEWLRYIALLDLVGFGMVVVTVFRHLDKATVGENRVVRLKLTEERRQKLIREFELASTIVRKTLAETGTESPRQLIEQYNKRNQVMAELEQVRQRLEAKKQEEGVQSVESSKQTLQKQIDELEQKLASAGGLMMSPSEMERRIKLLREKLQAAQSPAFDTSPGSASPTAEEYIGFGPGTPPGAALRHASQADGPVEAELPAFDSYQKLMQKAADLLLTEWEKIQPALENRASQYLAALTEQAYPRIVLNGNGSVECVDASSGATVALSNLPAAVQDLVYLGLLFSLVEASCTRSMSPFVLDDPFCRISTKLHALLGRMLLGIGKRTQVLLFTSQPNWAQYTKAVFRL